MACEVLPVVAARAPRCPRRPGRSPNRRRHRKTLPPPPPTRTPTHAHSHPNSPQPGTRPLVHSPPPPLHPPITQITRSQCIPAVPRVYLPSVSPPPFRPPSRPFSPNSSPLIRATSSPSSRQAPAQLSAQLPTSYSRATQRVPSAQGIIRGALLHRPATLASVKRNKPHANFMAISRYIFFLPCRDGYI